jgi:hypothetical protein
MAASRPNAVPQIILLFIGFKQDFDSEISESEVES